MYNYYISAGHSAIHRVCKLYLEVRDKRNKLSLRSKSLSNDIYY